MTQPRRSFRWMRWTCGGLLAIGLGIGGKFYLARGVTPTGASAQEVKTAPEKPAGVNVEVTHPHKGEMDRTTTQPGSVHAFESVQLYAGVSGYLKTQNVDIGDRVTKGQVLAVVDVPELVKQAQRYQAMIEQAHARVLQMKARVASAEAELDAARTTVPQEEALAKSKAAELRFRQRQLERMRDLYVSKSIDERLVDEKTEQRDAAREAEIAAREAVTSAKARVVATEAKIQQAKADLQEAEAEVKVAQAEFEKAEVLIRFATIVAPFDGVVTQRNYFPGDYVRAAHEGSGHMSLLTVQRTDRFRVVVHIPDRDVPFCDRDDPAVVEIDALPGERFPAKVSRVAQSEDQETKLMHVEIDLPNPTGKIYNGMYGRVTITLEKSQLLSVPTACLAGRARDGKGFVYVVRDGLAHQTPVTLGTEDGLQVGILTGLAEGDEVVVRPGTEIHDGTAVHVTCAEGPASPEPAH